MEQRPLFHEQLRYERERRGWSQADLAEKTGCDTKTVGRWESGERLPRPYHRQLLCELFGKNAEELGLTGLMPKPLSVPARRAVSVAAQAGENSPHTPLLEDWDEAPVVMSLYGRERECGEAGALARGSALPGDSGVGYGWHGQNHPGLNSSNSNEGKL